MFSVMFSAMNCMTSSDTSTPSGACSAFLLRMANRVSRSAGLTSVTNPIMKRPTRRASSVGIESGSRSQESTICPPACWMVLNVWKNSSWRPSLPARNWMSSTRRTSISRKCCLNSGSVLFRMASTKRFMNVSLDTYLT